jgi:hypothetical protein
LFIFFILDIVVVSNPENECLGIFFKRELFMYSAFLKKTALVALLTLIFIVKDVSAQAPSLMQKDAAQQNRPTFIKSFPVSALKSYSYQSDTNSLLMASNKNNTRVEQIYLPMSTGNFLIDVVHKVAHTNGDLSYIGNLLFKGSDHRVIYTVGRDGGIADVFGASSRMRFFVTDDNIWALNLNHKAVGRKPLINDLDTSKIINTNSVLNTAKKVLSSNGNDANRNALVVVDTLLLYTPNIVEAYPDGLTETLLNQEITTTNQAFVDSEVEVFLRLVGTQLVNYEKPSDFSALDDLAGALTGGTTDASLNSIESLRNELGADLVSMIRTHELNERGVCGVARFPDSASDILINISNVGDSGGSFCYDTFTHEVGHNFGAGHQQVEGSSVGSLSFSGALIVPEKFNTIMSSIGTGDLNRNYGLNKFSNPNTTCGGIACGDASNADNARTILSFAQQNADLRATVISGTVTPFQPSEIDRDGDGVLDDNDAFPFDASETLDSDNDGVGDVADEFPNNSSETTDTDGDGAGNNADDDDDNDGVLDIDDDLPLDNTEDTDSDNDGVGNNADQLPINPDEYADFDQDGSGDREDLDDDNDGVNDFASLKDSSNSELLVASVGDNNLYSFNGNNGDLNEVLVTVDEGGFSFRSEIRVSPTGEIYFIAFSDVMRFDRIKQRLDVVIDRQDIYTNFPNHLLFKRNSDLILNSGANPNKLSLFVKGYNPSSDRFGNQTASLEFEQGLRGMVLRLDDELLVVSRDQNKILYFNTDNLTEINTFSNAAQLDLPEHIVKGPDNKFYVTNAGSGNIIRLSSTGEFEDVFISSTSGGLNKPTCLDFGPDGNLYVCSSKTNQILRYNGQSGAFIDVFIDSTSGIDEPMGIVFTGALLDQSPFDDSNDSDGDGVSNLDDPFPLDANATLDSDSDGMPDSWEDDFGFDSQSSGDASMDQDNDGVTNQQEYLDGTDPTDSTSFTVVSEPLEPLSQEVDEVVEPPPSSSGGGGGSFSWMIALLFLVIVKQSSRNKS